MFFYELNAIHPSIKFTMKHTVPENNNFDLDSCSCPPLKSISYLDTLREIKEGKIITDLYRKPTDKNQNLLTSSCVTLSEVPAVCWTPRPLPAPFRSLDACRLGTNDPCCDRKVAKLIGPPNTSPCGNMSRNLEDGSIGPKYPDLNRTNEHRYIIVLVKALFSRESSGTSRSLFPSPRTI